MLIASRLIPGGGPAAFPAHPCWWTRLIFESHTRWIFLSLICRLDLLKTGTCRPCFAFNKSAFSALIHPAVIVVCVCVHVYMCVHTHTCTGPLSNLMGHIQYKLCKSKTNFASTISAIKIFFKACLEKSGWSKPTMGNLSPGS